MKLKKIYKNIINLLFPQYCLFCNKKGFLICDDCLNTKFTYVSKNYCPHCFKLIRNADSIHKVCKNQTFLDGLSSIVYYDKNSKELLIQYKYFHYYQYSRILAFLFLEKLYSLKWDIDIISPIPSHKYKINKRGFDHIELICKEMHLNYSILLEKVQFTKSQTSFNKNKRRENLTGSFSIYENIDEKHIQGKNVLLIDDVVTTASTLESAAEILKLMGINKVYALTFAKDDIYK